MDGLAQAPMKDATSSEMLRRAACKLKTGDLRMRLLKNALWGEGTQGTEASQYLQEKKPIALKIFGFWRPWNYVPRGML